VLAVLRPVDEPLPHRLEALLVAGSGEHRREAAAEAGRDDLVVAETRGGLGVAPDVGNPVGVEGHAGQRLECFELSPSRGDLYAELLRCRLALSSFPASSSATRLTVLLIEASRPKFSDMALIL